MVKCCRTYEEVFDGDVGKVIKLDRDGLHDLNVQCDWQQKGGTYWVRYIHIELLGEPHGPDDGEESRWCWLFSPFHMFWVFSLTLSRIPATKFSLSYKDR